MKIAILILIAFLLFRFDALAQDRGGAAGAKSIDRGKYIVDRIAMCSECHTPRNRTGELQVTEYLLGAPVTVSAPPFPNVKWALKAPAIAGLSGYTNEQGVRLLMEGLTTDGRTPDPPMPPYRMNRSDAEAVVAYLKSLK
jgi:mono/diheme cytochrome c family protein